MRDDCLEKVITATVRDPLVIVTLKEFHSARLHLLGFCNNLSIFTLRADLQISSVPISQSEQVFREAGPSSIPGWVSSPGSGRGS